MDNDVAYMMKLAGLLSKARAATDAYIDKYHKDGTSTRDRTEVRQALNALRVHIYAGPPKRKVHG